MALLFGLLQCQRQMRLALLKKEYCCIALDDPTSSIIGTFAEISHFEVQIQAEKKLFEARFCISGKQDVNPQPKIRDLA